MGEFGRGRELLELGGEEGMGGLVVPVMGVCAGGGGGRTRKQGLKTAKSSCCPMSKTKVLHLSFSV